MGELEVMKGKVKSFQNSKNLTGSAGRGSPAERLDRAQRGKPSGGTSPWQDPSHRRSSRRFGCKSELFGYKLKLSAIVIARNEDGFIQGCLRSLTWADEIVVVDTGSTDRTITLSKQMGAIVVKADPKGTFADWRNLGQESSSGQWLFYLDADERVTTELQQELKAVIAKRLEDNPRVYFVKRRNFFLGQEMRLDRVERLFYRSALERWEGELSEHPVHLGQAGELANCLIHLSHRDLTSMINKTILWSAIEAKLLYQTDHPPMIWWRFYRVVGGEFWRRLGREAYWRYGVAGLIEAGYQSFSVLVTYLKLRDLQNENVDVG